MVWFDFRFVLLRGFRGLTKNKARSLPIIVMVALGIAGGAGFVNASEIQYKSSQNIWEKSNLADLWINTVPLSSDIVSLGMRSLNEYVDFYDLRLVVPFKVSLREGQKNVSGYAVGLEWPIRINKQLKEGSPVVRSQILSVDGFFLESQFVIKQSLKVNDSFTFFLGGKKYSREIPFFAYASEYAFMPSSEKYFLPSLGTLPIVFFELATLQEMVYNRSVVNQILVKFKPGVSFATIESDLKNEALEGPLSEFLISVIPQDEYPSVKIVVEDSEGDKVFGYILATIMFVVASIVLYLTANQIIEGEKKQIGALRALGATRTEIFSSYITYALITGLFGALGGILGGLCLEVIFVGLIQSVVGNPEISWFFDPTIIILLSIVSLGLCIASVSVSGYRAARITPQSAIRPEPKYFSEESRLEKILAKFKIRLSPISSLFLRKFFQRKVHALLVVFGYSLVMMLFVVAVTFTSTVDYTVERHFNDFELWDVSATLKEYHTLDNINGNFSTDQVPSLKGIEPAISDYAGVIHNNSEIIFVLLLGYQNGTEMHHFGLESGEMFSGNTTAIVGSTLAYDLGKEVGDKIEVITRGGGTTNLTISGISSEFLLSSIIVSLETAGDVSGNPGKANVLLCKSSEPEVTFLFFEQNSLVAASQTLEQVLESFEFLLALVDVVLLIAVIILFLMGWLIALTLVALGINDKSDDLATLRAVGLRKSELIKLQVLESGILSVVCGVLGLVLGNYTSHWIMDYMSNYWANMLIYYPIDQIVLTYFFFLASIFSGNVLPLRRVLRIDLATLTREKVIS